MPVKKGSKHPNALALWRKRLVRVGLSLLVFSLFWFGLFVAVPAWAEFKIWPVRFKSKVAPWRVWGYSGYQLTSSMIKDQKSNIDQMTTTNVNLMKSAKGYIWRPWVLMWNAQGMIGATSNQRIVWTSANTTDTDSDSLARSFAGGFDFTVLPESRFPFKAYYNRSLDDSTEGENNVGQATVRETVGFSQDYKNKEGDFQVALRLDHSRDLLGSKNITGLYGVSVPSVDHLHGRYTLDTLSLGISKLFEQQTVDLYFKRSLAQSEFQGETNTSLDDTVVLNHSLNGGKRWAVNSLGNYSSIHTTSQAISKAEAFSTNQQLGNSLFWRSESMPLFLSGSTRVGVDTQEILPGSGGKAIARNISVVAGGNYQFSPATSLNFSVNANYQENETPTRFMIAQDSTQSLSANYSPERNPWGAFMHNWFASSAINLHEAMGSFPAKSFNAGVGQSLTKELPLSEAMLMNFSLNQTGFTNHVSDIKPIYGVNHTFSGTVTNYAGNSKVYLDLSLSDFHSFGDLVNNNQAISTQVSIEGLTANKLNWQGHLTSQWTRASEYGQIVVGVFSSADLMLNKQNLFDFRGLSYTSKLQIDAANQYLPVGNLVGSIAQSESRSWWNFLDFGVGKLSARMTLGVTETQGKYTPFERTGLFLFQVQRFFDTTFTSWSLPSFLRSPITMRDKEDD